jgi:hypothetical protein
MEIKSEGNTSSQCADSEILTYIRLGLSVIPIKEGEKIPHWILGPKHNLLEVRATIEEASKWFDVGVKSWAIAGGAVSENLVCLDFDEKHYVGLYDLWYAKLSDDQKAVVDTCAINSTRNKGTHVRYRTETSQPTIKLASRVELNKETQKESIVTTAEVRGEGAYALIPPSAGYTFIQGDLENLPLVTDEMHEELIDVLRTFNEVEDEPATEYEWKQGDIVAGDRPGDRLNALMSWNEILEPHGWVQELDNHWRRPGKKEGEGISATTNYEGIPMLYVFSSAAAPFEQNRGYSKFHVFALLNHNGNFSEAAIAAAELYPDEELVERDWDDIYSTEILKNLADLPVISMTKKLLEEMPENDWAVGYERLTEWNKLRLKPSNALFLKRTWNAVVKNESLLRKGKEAKAKKEPRVRIAKCPVPEKIISFDEWKETIVENFPDLHFAAETSLSTLAQLLIKDITNPFALVLVDVPSSGKTIAINFFDDIPELTYSTDKFTPASFVSNAANVQKKDLEEIDLLPRIQYRMFLIRDMATLFARREEDLTELLGILTRVLDGEGLNTDSGVHGQRQYNGEYLFMMLAASTPIPPRVLKAMGNLGSRLFFLGMNSRKKDEDELAAQIADQSYKEKEKICRLATRDFLYSLWNTYPNGIEWDKKADDAKLLPIIGRCATLLANLRGVINVWEDSFNNEFKYGIPLIERPDRVNQLFYNLARGHALICGRTQIAMDDLKAVVELCIDGAPSGRAKLFRKLIEYSGTMTTSEVKEEMNCSKPTALKEMKTLEILKVCSLIEHSSEDFEITLCDDFKWFLSSECSAIRGIQLSDSAIESE